MTARELGSLVPSVALPKIVVNSVLRCIRRQKVRALSPAPIPPSRSLISRCTPPVDDVLHVADGILNAPLLGAQDDAVEVGVDHRGAQALELSYQPAAGHRVGSVGGKAMPEGQT